MLKIRLMGTKRDIKWFRRILERCKDLQVLEFSDLYTNKGTDRFYRCYVEVERAEKARQSLRKNNTVSGTNQ